MYVNIEPGYASADVDEGVVQIPASQPSVNFALHVLPGTCVAGISSHLFSFCL